jgi:hypothetical protein
MESNKDNLPKELIELVNEAMESDKTKEEFKKFLQEKQKEKLDGNKNS